jgi:hypothetical protein
MQQNRRILDSVSGHIASPKGTQLADIMLTVGQRYGVEMEKFGVSSKAFPL